MIYLWTVPCYNSTTHLLLRGNYSIIGCYNKTSNVEIKYPTFDMDPKWINYLRAKCSFTLYVQMLAIPSKCCTAFQNNCNCNCLFRISSFSLIGDIYESSLKESLHFDLIDLNHDEDLEFYNKQSIRKSPSISAALLRRIEYNTSRMIATTDFMWKINLCTFCKLRA